MATTDYLKTLQSLYRVQLGVTRITLAARPLLAGMS